MSAQPQVRITVGGEPVGPTAAGIPLFQAMLAAPLVGISLRWPNVLHAVEMDEICSNWLVGTATGACGAKHLRVLKSGQFVVEWPPAVGGMPEGKVRCRECWESTGKKRPRSRWLKKETP